MGEKIRFGVKPSKFLTPDYYDAVAGVIHSQGVAIGDLVESALPAEDLSVNEDGSTNPDFDQAAAYALEVIEQHADALKTNCARLRSLVNNRPKIAQGPTKKPDLEDEDEEGDEDEETAEAADLSGEG